jgi:hypothetical protein
LCPLDFGRAAVIGQANLLAFVDTNDSIRSLMDFKQVLQFIFSQGGDFCSICGIGRPPFKVLPDFGCSHFDPDAITPSRLDFSHCLPPIISFSTFPFFLQSL